MAFSGAVLGGEEVHTTADTAALRGTQARLTQEGLEKKNGGRRVLDVVEMYSFVQSMGIDPVKESEMVWIAEEALNVQLPPGWNEHTDDRNRPYFANTNTGESSWFHPMDDVFHDLVEYFRQVQEDGGFWCVEDDLAEHEEHIRRDLAEWQELFDERGRKFFYNKQTEESRLEDPRHATYHNLYARIKMVGKMREHLPHLATVPRPEDPRIEEERQKVRKELEEKQNVSLKMQSTFRMMMARRRAIKQRERRQRNCAPPPEREKLRLCLKRTGHAAKFDEDLVISLTSARRYEIAVVKIQAFFRKCLARVRFIPMREHHRQLDELARRVQRRWKLYVGDKEERERIPKAIAHLAYLFRKLLPHQRDCRLYDEVVDEWHAEQARRLRCTIRIQSFFRGVAAKRAVENIRRKQNAAVRDMQRYMRTFRARMEARKCLFLDRPLHFSLAPTVDEKVARLVPWSWQLLMVPTDDCDIVREPGVGLADLFCRHGVAAHRDIAATIIQKWVRGKAGRRRRKARIRELREEKKRREQALALQPWAALQIQKNIKGWQVRRSASSWRPALYARWLARQAPNLAMIGSLIEKDRDQAALKRDMEMEVFINSATIMQTYWRRYRAQKQYKRMCEELLWPVKLNFEYFATGDTTVRTSVSFFANPGFDKFKHMDTYGHGFELFQQLDDMTSEVTLAVDKFLIGQGVLNNEEEEEEEDDDDDEELCGAQASLFGLSTEVPSGMDFNSVDFDSLASPTRSTFDVTAGLGGGLGEEDPSKTPTPSDSADGEEEGEEEEPGPRRVVRRTYAGTYIDGVFYRSKVTNVENLSEKHKQQLMRDLDEQRRQKIEELQLRRKKHVARELKRQKKEAERLKAATARSWRPAKKSPMEQTMFEMLPARGSLNDLDPRTSQRLMVAERRRIAHTSEKEAMSRSMSSLPSPTTASMPVSPLSVAQQQRLSPLALGQKKQDPSSLVHAHVHMHVHEHHEELHWGRPAGGLPGALPSLGKDGMRRSTSAFELVRPGDTGRRDLYARAGFNLPPPTKTGWSKGSPLQYSKDPMGATVRRAPMPLHPT